VNIVVFISSRLPAERYRDDATSFLCRHLQSCQFRHKHLAEPVLANWSQYAATSTPSAWIVTLRRCCCKPTAHCNASRVRRVSSTPALQHQTN